MKFPDQWRELSFDPFALDLGPNVFMDEVIGYPYAANDVLVCDGTVRGDSTQFVLKYERSRNADLGNEANVLRRLGNHFDLAPSLLVDGFDSGASDRFVVVSFLDGERLPRDLAGDAWGPAREDLFPYITDWARTLARIHAIPLAEPNAPTRKQQAFPGNVPGCPSEAAVAAIADRLRADPLKRSAPVLIHGDMHYANVLWNGSRVAGVVDWGFAGQSAGVSLMWPGRSSRGRLKSFSVPRPNWMHSSTPIVRDLSWT